MQMNNIHQQEQTDKDPFVLSLSISTKTANSKKQAESITKFKLLENIPVNETSLTPILTKHLQSTNLWYKNKDIDISNQDNYSGITGITIDYDDTVPISQFNAMFSKWHFILYPSTHHVHRIMQLINDEKYHVIFPIDPDDYDQYIDAEWHKRAYQ